MVQHQTFLVYKSGESFRPHQIPLTAKSHQMTDTLKYTMLSVGPNAALQ